MEKHTIVPAVGLLLEKNGTIFVGRRQNTGFADGYLNLPAGHIDPDETPRQAIVRECKEEIGIDIQEDDLEFVHVQYIRNNEIHDRTHYYYRMSGEGLAPINAEPHKCSAVSWIPLGTQLDEFMPFMRSALEAIMRGEQYTEFDRTT